MTDPTHVVCEQAPGGYNRYCARCGRSEPVPMGREGIAVTDFATLFGAFEDEHRDCPIRHAFSVWRPWGHAIIAAADERLPAGAAKDVENRSFAFGPYFLHREVAIHSAQRWDEDGAVRVRALGIDVPPRQAVPTGFIGVARLGGWVRGSRGLPTAWSTNLTREDALRVVLNRWFAGPVGWVLHSVRRLPRPIAFPGDRRVWRVPDEVGTQLARALESADTAGPLRLT